MRLFSDATRLSCDVKGRAVSHRGADDGQAQGNIDAAFKISRFERHEPVVVEHGNNAVELAFERAHENRVGRIGAGRIDAFPFRLRHGRGYVQDFFVAEEAVFARMRVKARNCDAGRPYSKVLQSGEREAVVCVNTASFVIIVKAFFRLTWVVTCTTWTFSLANIMEKFCCPRFVGQYFRMPGIIYSGHFQGLFAYRVGDDRVDIAFKRKLDSFDNIRV